MINSVQFDYFGRPRKLRYDSNAICDLEDAGVNVLGFISGIAQSYVENNTDMALNLMGGVKFLRLFLYHGLKWDDNTLTLLKIGNWIDVAQENGAEITDMWKAVIKALTETTLVKSFMKQAAEEAKKAEDETQGKNESAGMMVNLPAIETTENGLNQNNQLPLES